MSAASIMIAAALVGLFALRAYEVVRARLEDRDWKLLREDARDQFLEEEARLTSLGLSPKARETLLRRVYGGATVRLFRAAPTGRERSFDRAPGGGAPAKPGQADA